MARTCLVLGGKGFIGSAVTRTARERGYAVTAAGREDLDPLRGSSWDLVINANGNSKKFLAERDPLLDFDLSVRSVMHSLESFRAGCYVFLSSVDVYPDKSNPDGNREDAVIDPAELSRYGLHKWLAENLVRRCAHDWLILRVAGCVGHGLRKNPVYDVLKGLPLHVHPDSRYQYLRSDRLAAMAFDLVDRGLRREVVNIAGEGTVTVREAADIAGKPVVFDETARPPLEHYRINIDKLKTYCPVDETRYAIRKFTDDLKSGRAALA